MSADRPQVDTHSVIVRLQEEDYRFLKTAASLRGTRTVAAAVHLCVAWMISNLDTSLWDEVLRAPRGRGSKHQTDRGEAQAGVLMAPAPPTIGHEPESIDLVVISDEYPDDRRLSRRYPIQTGVHARTEDDPAVLMTGSTVNISSTGLLLLTSDPVEPNVTVRVSVDWPLFSVRGRPLRLWSRGRTVWRSGELAGLHVENWEFCEGVRVE